MHGVSRIVIAPPYADRPLRSIFQALFPVHRLAPEHRRLLWLTASVAVVQGFAQAHLSALVPFTRLALGLTEADMSLVLSITRFASLGAIALSWWSDRSGRRRPYLVAVAILVASTGATGLVSTAEAFTTLQSIARLATAAVGTLGVVLIAESLPADCRAFGIGTYAAAASLGAGGGQLMLLVAGRGPEAWRIPFLVTTLGFLALPWFRRVGESPLVEPDKANRVPLRPLLTGREAPVFWISGVAGLAAAALPAVSLAFTNERLINGLGLSTGVAATLALSAGTIGGLGFWIGGRLADTWGRRPMTVVSIAAAAFGAMWLFSTENLLSVWFAIVIGAFGSFAYLPAAAAHRTELFPTENRTTAGAMGGYLATIGSALALGAGRLTIAEFGLANTVRVMAIPSAVAIGLTLLLPETRGQLLRGART